MYVAAFRAYAWDQDIALIAGRFFGSCPGARQVVLIDETNGEIDVGSYEKVAHTSDTQKYGLHQYGYGNPLWFNCDYGIYILRCELPDYDYYVLSESDLAVNLSLEPMMESIKQSEIDFVARSIRPATSEWMWHKGALTMFAEPWGALLFFMVVSARAADLLYKARHDLSRAIERDSNTYWPFCEVFVPSVLKQHAGMNVVGIEQYAITQHLNFRPRISLSDPKAHTGGTLVHSVLGSRSFTKALIGEHGARNYFTARSSLRAGLMFEDRGLVTELLEQALIAADDRMGLHALKNTSAGDAVLRAETDIALGKPAVSSSTGAWSRYADVERDAGGANSTKLSLDYGFHTNKEVNPWWMTDLLCQHVIDKIAIVNRESYSERFKTFQIHSSIDGLAWQIRFVKLDLDDVSSDIGTPWTACFADPFVARYVRITLVGENVLHLRRVQVYGRTIV